MPGLPCDIYASAGTPCVAAHSTVRVLYRSYAGPLYKLTRLRDKSTATVAVLSPGGIANVSRQDEFCGGGGNVAGACVVSQVFDQSGSQNHLRVYPKDVGVDAAGGLTTLARRTVHGMYFDKGMGYRNDDTVGVPKGEDPESMYMVVSGSHWDDHCCFDYGGSHAEFVETQRIA